MLKKRTLLVIGGALTAALVYLGARFILNRSVPVEVPYAGLMETAAQKWGLHFLDDWSVWEKRVDRLIDDFYDAQRRRKKSYEVEYFKWRYQQLWAHDADLDDLPTAVSLEPTGGIRKSSGGTLGSRRQPVEPAMVVDLRAGLIFEGGLVDGGSRFIVHESLLLTDEEHYRAMYRGIPPVWNMNTFADQPYRTVYVRIGSSEPLALPIGELPPELDPAEPFKQMSDADLQTAIRRLAQIVNRPTPHQEKTLRAASQDPVDRMYAADLFNGVMRAWRERPSAWAGVSMEPLPPVSAGVEQAGAVEAASAEERAKPTQETNPPPIGIPYLQGSAYASPARAVGAIYGMIHGDLNVKTGATGASVMYTGTGAADSFIAFTDNGAEPPISETYSYLGKRSGFHRYGDAGYGDAFIGFYNGRTSRVQRLVARTYCPWDRFWLWLNDPARYSISSEASAEIHDSGSFPEVWGERESRAGYP